MSAICGIYFQDGRRVNQRAIASMTDVLADYGPDGVGMTFDGCLAFGHRKLQVTPESIHEQLPLCNPDGTLSITADARIDNRAELIALLGPVSAKDSIADSELILLSFERWGEECVDKLYGDYAFAIWDKAKQRLFCARDADGGRPFFYHYSKGVFAFASTIRALFKLKYIPRDLDRKRAFDYLLNLHVTGDRTFYSAVKRLPQGHTLSISRSEPMVQQYWSLKHLPEIRFQSDADYVSVFRNLFEEAIRCRLRSTRPVGINLSGGLDSGAIAAVAAKILQQEGRQLHAFSYVPTGTELTVPAGRVADETPWVERIRRAIPNVVVNYVRAQGHTPLHEIEEVIKLQSRPIPFLVDFHRVTSVREAKRRHNLGVVLTGAGGNDTISFAGDGYFASLARHGRLYRLMKELDAWQRFNRRGRLKAIQSEVIKPLLPRLLWNQLRKRSTGEFPAPDLALVSTDLLSEYDFNERLHEHYERELFERVWPDWREERRRRLRFGLGESRDLQYARACSNRLEARPPARDRKIVEYCFGIPIQQYISGGKDRLLLRRAVQGVLPEENIWKRRMGYPKADSLKQLVKDYGEIKSAIQAFRTDGMVRSYINIDVLEDMADFVHRHAPAAKALIVAESMLRGYMLGKYILMYQDGRLGFSPTSD